MNTRKLFPPHRTTGSGRGPLLAAILLAASPATQATLTSSGSVRDLAGDPWPGTGPLVIGYSGFASMLLNDHIDGNGILHHLLETWKEFRVAPPPTPPPGPPSSPA